jgi:hypothetical protein
VAEWAAAVVGVAVAVEGEVAGQVAVVAGQVVEAVESVAVVAGVDHGSPAVAHVQEDRDRRWAVHHQCHGPVRRETVRAAATISRSIDKEMERVNLLADYPRLVRALAPATSQGIGPISVNALAQAILPPIGRMSVIDPAAVV